MINLKKQSKHLLLVFSIALIISGIASCTSSNFKQKEISYKVEETADSVIKKSMLVTIPPGSRLSTSSGTYKKGSSVRFQTIYVSDLSKDYYKSLDQVGVAEYYSYRNDRKRPAQRFNLVQVKTDWGLIGFYGENDTSTLPPNKINISSLESYEPTIPDGMIVSDLLVEVDYDKIFSDSLGNPLEVFSTLPFDVLRAASWGELHFDWARSISQDVTLKVFELLPTPETQSLTRFGMVENEYYTFLLLHPNIHLSIDRMEPRKNLASDLGSSGFYTYQGSSRLSFYRNQYGFIEQLPYIPNLDLDFQEEFWLGEQTIDGNEVQYYGLGSTADLHFSKAVRDASYLGLFQSFFKNSAFDPTVADEDFRECCNEPYECGTGIVLGNSIKELVYPEINCFDIPVFEQKAIFDDRSLIVPEFAIYLSDQLIYVKAGTTLRMLKQNYLIPQNFVLNRIYRGQYRKFENSNLDIVLLPGDKIN